MEKVFIGAIMFLAIIIICLCLYLLFAPKYGLIWELFSKNNSLNL
jgi:hypothetical protein